MSLWFSGWWFCWPHDPSGYFSSPCMPRDSNFLIPFGSVPGKGLGSAGQASHFVHLFEWNFFWYHCVFFAGNSTSFPGVVIQPCFLVGFPVRRHWVVAAAWWTFPIALSSRCITGTPPTENMVSPYGSTAVLPLHPFCPVWSDFHSHLGDIHRENITQCRLCLD